MTQEHKSALPFPALSILVAHQLPARHRVPAPNASPTLSDIMVNSEILFYVLASVAHVLKLKLFLFEMLKAMFIYFLFLLLSLVKLPSKSSFLHIE